MNPACAIDSHPRELIASHGYFLTRVELQAAVRDQVVARRWEELDRLIRQETLPGGGIFSELLKYAEFSEIEFIISIRSSLEYPDEDGIWHDDGTRLLAFSLSLTLDHIAIEGGRLEIRKRDAALSAGDALPTQPCGTLIVFATGVQGFEHKINRVIQGERIVIAGWCT